MRFALLNNERTEAAPKMKGLCPGCQQPVMAKCGKQRIWHWAHLTKMTCDSWHEPETEWHRSWKGNFPLECQEVLQFDAKSGEKHIADVRTNHGLIIEFQHSHLDPRERSIRENFYKNMVWVIDGTRLKKDYPRFLAGKGQNWVTVMAGLFLVSQPEKCFPATWLESSVPVIFDFQGIVQTDPPDISHENLWCLFSGRMEGTALVASLTRRDFVTASSNGQLTQELYRAVKSANNFMTRIQYQSTRRVQHRSTRARRL